MSKNLHPRDVSDILKRYEGGETYTEIAKDMASQGYTNKRGGKLLSQDISYFMIKHGVRVNSQHTKGNGNKKLSKYRQQMADKCTVVLGQKKAPQKSNLANGVIKDIEELLTSNLQTELKLRLLKTLV